MFSWFWIWFQFFSYIFMSIFNILVTSSNQKRILGNLCYNSTFSRNYWCASNPKRCSFPESTFCCFIVGIFFTLIPDESLFQSCKHRCAVSLHCSCTSLDMKAGSQLVRSEKSLSVNGWETSHPAGGKRFPFFAT